MNAKPRPPALPRVPHQADRPTFVRVARDGVHPTAVSLHGLHVPAPADGRRVFSEPGSADAAGAAGRRAGRGPVGRHGTRGAERPGQGDEGVAL